MAKEFTSGKITESMMETGRITKCTEKVSSHGKMERNTLESTSKIKSKAKEYSHGLMADATTASGSMADSMEMESTRHQKAIRRRDSGRTERMLNGFDLLLKLCFTYIINTRQALPIAT
jgi:hypothetical protein